MIINRLKEGIGVSHRDENRNVVRNVVSYDTFQPHFYVKKQDVPEEFIGADFSIPIEDSYGQTNLSVRYNTISSLPSVPQYSSLEKEPLVKVTWKPSSPTYTRRVRKWFEVQDIDTYEADVKIHHKFAVQTYNTEFGKTIGQQWVEAKDHRRMYWDMEWQQGGEYNGQITCISAYDSYDEEYYCWLWRPIENNESDVSSRVGELEGYLGYELKEFNDEMIMLADFMSFILEKDPDMLISWFGWKFDLPKLLERITAHNMDARLLSPFNEVDGISWRKGEFLFSEQNTSAISQPIKGRITVPLDMVFERKWNDAQLGTLPSMALDYVSETILGEKKLVSDKFPDKDEFFARGWLEDTQTYCDYAVVDVKLLVDIDKKFHATDSVIALQNILMAPFDACFYASHMGGIYFMRNALWKAPTGKKGDRRSYDGAMVYNPLSEATNGLHENVAAFDFSALYPSMIIARNISFETISEEPTEFAVNIKTPKDFSPVVEEEMRYFKTDELGVLPRALLDLQNLRNEYKGLMKKEPDNYDMWNNNQLAVKRLSASFYGILAFQGFGWSNVDLAESITASAREAIREAARIAKEMS